MPWKILFEFVPCIPRKQQACWLTYNLVYQILGDMSKYIMFVIYLY